MDKKEIRRKYIQIRKEILNKDEKSKRIVNQIMNHPKYIQSDVIACYCSLEDEVNIDEVIFDAWSKGKRVVVPKINKDIMNFHEITNMNQLKIQSFRVREPIHDLVFDKNKIDLFLVPGVCFDFKGNRMGYGKGYYDRYLSLESYKIGLCFKEQICEDIVVDQYDVLMDEIIVD